MAYILEEDGGEGTGGAVKGGYTLEEPSGKGDELKLAKRMGGFEKGVRDIGLGTAQFISHVLPESFKEKANELHDKLADFTGIGPKQRDLPSLDQRIQDEEAAYLQQREAEGETGTDFARIGGNIAGTLPIAFLPGMQLKAGQGIFDMANILRGTTQAQVAGAAQPVTAPGNYDEIKRKQLEDSFLAGILSAPASAALGKAINPSLAPETQLLQDAGVRMTPGQYAGGALNQAEAKMGYIPGLGHLVGRQRQQAVDDLNRAVYSKALEGTGVDAAKLPVGREGIAAVKDAIGKQYDNLLTKLVWKPDQQFSAEVSKIGQMTSGMTVDAQKRFTYEVNNIMSRVNNGVMLGQTYKNVQSDIKKAASNYLHSGSAQEREIGAALAAVADSMKDALVRSNPMHAKALDQANRNWSMYTVLRDAGKQVKEDAAFSPQQLQSAVRSQDKSLGKGSFATGKARMQDLSDAAVSRLGPGTQASDTAKGLIAGGTGAAIVSNPLLLAGMGAAALPYTKSGQKIIGALMQTRSGTSKQAADAIANALLKTGPLGGVALTNE